MNWYSEWRSSQLDSEFIPKEPGLKKMDYVKICKCCHKKHNVIPDDAREWIDEELKLVGKDGFIGWFFECDCKSTLFVPKKLVLAERGDK